ncbi:hypothetical protein L596_010134 [Steinernema carpocapsae]|uniref:Uncharacterized protein n=1 Tax=Steinernema carpocapsae TaxID=34508 RepID=A0A4U5PHF2_STECR|nr:hypothetical protein L596_010134 [Steinernema carpocapsae]
MWLRDDVEAYQGESRSQIVQIRRRISANGRTQGLPCRKMPTNEGPGTQSSPNFQKQLDACIKAENNHFACS